MSPALSRRQILVAAAALTAGGGAALIASASDDGDGDQPAETETISTVELRTDTAALVTLLDLEESSIVAYEAIGGSAPREFGEHEREHAAALRRMIGRLGSVPPDAKPRAEYRAGFPPIGGERAARAFALDLETTSIGAYADALTRITTETVRVTLAAILAAECEHAAVLLGLLGRPQVPDAFVTGTPQELE